MSQSAPRKFTFDTVFDGDGGIAQAAPPRPKRMYTAAEVEQIKAQSYAEGEQSATAVAQARTAEAVAQIAQLSGQALGALARTAHSHREASAHLALSVGRKIADAALERFPQAPVSAAMTDLARELEAQPVLKVQVAADLVEPVQAALEQAAQACGFPGQIVVTGESDRPHAAFTLDWGEGRADFDPDAALARVAEALDTALAAEGLHAEPLISTDEANYGRD